MINSNQSKQSENPKSSDSFILENGESGNGVFKRKSVYSDVLCSDCTNKIFNEFCPECKSAYKSAKRKKAYHAKKAKIAANKQTRLTNSDNIHGNEFEASIVETVDPKKKTNTPFKSNKSTLANMKWKFRKFVTKSTTKTIDHFVSYINLQDYALQNKSLTLYKVMLKTKY